MKFADLLNANAKTIPTHSDTFQDARLRHPILLPYESPKALAHALRGRSLRLETRARLVVALVSEDRTLSSRLWASLLLTAFERSLCRLRFRLGRPANEDIDQHLLEAFVRATRSRFVSLTYPLLSIRRATIRFVVAACRGEERDEDTVAFDEEEHGFDLFPVDKAVSETVTAEVIRRLPLACDMDEALTRAFMATLAEGESTRDYVERVFSNCPKAEREAHCRRLRSARARVIARLRDCIVRAA